MKTFFINLGAVVGAIALMFGLLHRDGAAAGGFAIAAGLCMLSAAVAHLADAMGRRDKD